MSASDPRAEVEAPEEWLADMPLPTDANILPRQHFRSFDAGRGLCGQRDRSALDLRGRGQAAIGPSARHWAAAPQAGRSRRACAATLRRDGFSGHGHRKTRLTRGVDRIVGLEAQRRAQGVDRHLVDRRRAKPDPPALDARSGEKQGFGRIEPRRDFDGRDPVRFDMPDKRPGATTKYPCARQAFASSLSRVARSVKKPP